MKPSCILALILIFAGSSNAVRCFCDKRNCPDALMCTDDFCVVGFKSDVRLDQLCGNGTVRFECKANVDGWTEVCTCQEDFCNTFAYLRRHVEALNKKTQPTLQLIEADPTTLQPGIPSTKARPHVGCYCDKQNCGDELSCYSDQCFVAMNASVGFLEQRCSQENEPELAGCSKDWNGFEIACFCQHDFCNTFRYLRGRLRNLKKLHNITLQPEFTTPPDFLEQIVSTTSLSSTVNGTKLTKCYCTEEGCDRSVCWGHFCLVGVKSHGEVYRTCAYQHLTDFTTVCLFHWNGWQKVCACKEDYCNSYHYLRMMAQNEQPTESPPDTSAAEPERVQCYSCMSESNLSKSQWMRKQMTFYPRAKITHACNNANLSDAHGNSVATVDCDGPCVTLIEVHGSNGSEMSGYIRGCSEKLDLSGIPEPLHPEIEAVGPEEVCQVIEQQDLIQSDNPEISGKLFLCSCYSDQCNNAV